MPLSPDVLRKLRHAISPSRGEERLSLGEELDAVLGGGLLRGAVVELASPLGRARSTSLALAACAAAQRQARLVGGHAWCAWIAPERTLFAPGVIARGVDVERLLVVTPSREMLPRIAVRVVKSRVFSVVVVDAAHVARVDALSIAVRRLALALEGSDCTVLLSTDLRAPRSTQLPCAARIELSRTERDRVALRVAKDRFGRLGSGRVALGE